MVIVELRKVVGMFFLLLCWIPNSLFLNFGGRPYQDCRRRRFSVDTAFGTMRGAIAGANTPPCPSGSVVRDLHNLSSCLDRFIHRFVMVDIGSKIF
ncbi:unnamed protein product [Macrosiphum euphorbiae]|uniref:Secreted protein n=1 Tax=Macrosiphum euphorbiae TaxID=13131 RepID=A0AAV0W658_9HEMI|nr:unnamed protein product [Macrosiphum euphorbiae]